MKHKNMLLVSLLMASLVLLGGCQSRTLEPQDPEPTVGESVVEPDPEPVQPVEQEPQIPDDAPGFYTTRQEMNGWEVFSLSTAQDLIDLSDWVQGGEDTAERIFVLEDNIDLGGVELVRWKQLARAALCDGLGHRRSVARAAPVNHRYVVHDFPSSICGAVGAASGANHAARVRTVSLDSGHPCANSRA